MEAAEGRLPLRPKATSRCTNMAVACADMAVARSDITVARPDIAVPRSAITVARSDLTWARSRHPLERDALHCRARNQASRVPHVVLQLIDPNWLVGLQYWHAVY